MTKTVVFIFHQSNFQANGGLNSLLQLVNKLDGIRPVIVTQKQMDESLIDGCYYYLEKSGETKLGVLWDMLRWNIQVARIIKKESAFAVHVNDITSLWYSFFGARLRLKNIIFNIRGIIEPQRKYGVKWLLVNVCPKIIVLSEEMKEALRKRLPLVDRKQFGKKTRTIYSIIDHLRFNTINKGESPYGDETIKHLLVSASFNKLKNQHEFLKSVVVKFRDKPVKFHFVGDFTPESNSYASKCAKLVDDLKLNRCVKFHGYKQDIENYYKHAYLTLVTSKREGLARCMIESLACGTPVVSYDVASANEVLVEQSCGRLVEQGDFESFKEAIVELINDTDKYNQLSLNCLKVVSQVFGSSKSIEQYQNLLNAPE